MKKWLTFFFVGSVLARAGESANDKPAGLGRVINAVQQRATVLACVTPQPIFVPSSFASLCGPRPSPEVLAHAAPHENRSIKVYITPSAKQILVDGKGVYPVGTLIVKEKCRGEDGKDTELFTAMIKREGGYNPSVGDWEFLVMDRAALITASGKIDSCMECHQRFAQTDYVSRVYLQKVTASR